MGDATRDIRYRVRVRDKRGGARRRERLAQIIAGPAGRDPNPERGDALAHTRREAADLRRAAEEKRAELERARARSYGR
jgi:hypothetical protein